MIISGMHNLMASARDAVMAETLAAAASVLSPASGDVRAFARFPLSLMPANPSLAPGTSPAPRHIR
jgi:hypothetical protein